MSDRATRRILGPVGSPPHPPERKTLFGLPVPAWLRGNGTKSGVTFVGPNTANIIRLNSSVSVPDAEELTEAIAYTTSAYAFTAIDYRMRKVSEPDIYVAEDDDDGLPMEVFGHEITDLLRNPSEDFDFAELMKLTEAYHLITGAAAWVKVRDTANRVARLMPYSGDQIKSYAANGRIYGRFEVLTPNGTWEQRPPEDVVYFREVNPLSWRTNVSRLDVALAQLDLGHQVNRTVRNFMRRAMFPGGVISPHHEWDPDDDEWNKYVNDIEAWHAGPANAGSPLVVTRGTTFSRAAIPLKDLLPSELLDRIEAVTASVFGVPPIVLGWKIGLENSPWSQMSEARRSVYEETLIPRWEELARKASRQLLAEEDRAVPRYLKFHYEGLSALRADDKDRAEVADKMADVWTRNERRAYTGKDPLPDEDPRGDEIGRAAPSAGGIAELLAGGGKAGGPGPVDDAAAMIAEAEAMALLMGIRMDAKRMDTKALEWMLFDINTKAAESTWERGVARILTDLKRETMKIAARTLREEKADAAPDPDSVLEFLAALSDWIREKGEALISAALSPLIISTGETALKRAAAQIGVSFATLQPGLLTYAAEEAAFLASVMGQTTGKRVAETVQRSLASGGVIRDLQRALQESAAFSRDRAKMVARTETTRAWNGSQRRTLSEFEAESTEGVIIIKEWLDSQDERVRDEHVELRGEKRRIDEVFSNGLQEPGEPNCRCTMLYHMERPAGAGSPAVLT